MISVELVSGSEMGWKDIEVKREDGSINVSKCQSPHHLHPV